MREFVPRRKLNKKIKLVGSEKEEISYKMCANLGNILRDLVLYNDLESGEPSIPNFVANSGCERLHGCFAKPPLGWLGEPDD